MSTSWKDVRALILGDITAKGPGADLDSDREYGARAGASVTTVKRAMSDLASRGLIRRRRGRRTVVLAPPDVIPGSSLSFRRSARDVHGQEVDTKVIEKTTRPRRREGEDAERETRALEALGLGSEDPLTVLCRKRVIAGETRAVHRSYLDPGLLPMTFLADHDFESESLLDVLEGYGFKLRSRQTRIRATLPSDYEARLFGIVNEPVLNVDQRLYATKDESDQLITLEFMNATYVRWEYVIDARV